MDQAQREAYLKLLLADSSCKAEALYELGKRLMQGSLKYCDYIAITEMLGFPIRGEEEDRILDSLVKEFPIQHKRSNRPVQKAPSQA